ncbi:hypothetical protein Efla_001814 [Eimeria flavescens]
MEGPALLSSVNRKIAQLTKVVYRLNTQQEDHELHLQALREAFEQEVEDILVAADAKVAACAREARAAQVSQVTQAEIEQLKQQLEAARKRVEEEGQLQQAAFDSEIKRRDREWGAELDKLKEEWAGWQASLGAVSLALRNACVELQQSKETLGGQLRDSETEIQKLNRLLADNEAEKAALRAEARQLQQQVEEAAAAAAAARAAEAAAAAAAAASQAQRQAASQQVEALDCKLLLLQQQRLTDEQRNSQTVSELQQQLGEAQQRALLAEAQAREAREAAANLELLSAAQQVALSSRACMHACMHVCRFVCFRRTCAAHESKEQEAAECLLSERELRASTASVFNKLVAALEEQGLRREELMQQTLGRWQAAQQGQPAPLLQPTASPCSRGTLDAADSLRRQLCLKDVELQEAHTHNKQLKQELLEAQKAHDEALQAEALRISRMEEAVRMANGRAEKVTLSARREAAEREEAATEALRTLKEELLDAQAQLEATALRLQAAENEADSRQKEVAELSAALQQSDGALQAAQDALAALQITKAEAEAKAKDAQDVAAQQLQQLQRQCGELSARAAALDAELRLCRLCQEKEAQEACGVEHGLRRQLQALRAEAEEADKELKNTQRQLLKAREQEQMLGQSVAELKTRLEEETVRNREAHAKQEEELQQQRQTLQEKSEEALAAAAAAAAAEMETLKQQHEAACKEAEASTEKKLKELKAQLLADHSVQLQAVICKHRAQQEEKDKEHQQEKSALERALKESAAAAAAAAAARLNAATAQVTALQQQLKMTEEELRQSRACSSERLQELQGLRAEHQRILAEQAVAAERQQAALLLVREEAAKMKQTLELKLQLSQRALTRQHEAALTELQTEHKAELELQQSRLETIEKRLAAEIKRFEMRPPRDEDVQAINKLTKRLEEAHAAVVQRDELIRRLKFEFLSQCALSRICRSTATPSIMPFCVSSVSAPDLICCSSLFEPAAAAPAAAAAAAPAPAARGVAADRRLALLLLRLRAATVHTPNCWGGIRRLHWWIHSTAEEEEAAKASGAAAHAPLPLSKSSVSSYSFSSSCCCCRLGCSSRQTRSLACSPKAWGRLFEAESLSAASQMTASLQQTDRGLLHACVHACMQYVWDLFPSLSACVRCCSQELTKRLLEPQPAGLIGWAAVSSREQTDRWAQSPLSSFRLPASQPMVLLLSRVYVELLDPTENFASFECQVTLGLIFLFSC